MPGGSGGTGGCLGLGIGAFSVHPAGVGGTGSKMEIVGRRGGRRGIDKIGTLMFPTSIEPFLLCENGAAWLDERWLVGGGPGGGGGKGIPGVQEKSLSLWGVTAPAEAERREAGATMMGCVGGI